MSKAAPKTYLASGTAAVQDAVTPLPQSSHSWAQAQTVLWLTLQAALK